MKLSAAPCSGEAWARGKAQGVRGVMLARRPLLRACCGVRRVVLRSGRADDGAPPTLLILRGDGGCSTHAAQALRPLSSSSASIPCPQRRSDAQLSPAPVAPHCCAGSHGHSRVGIIISSAASL